ncbi:hypothetical protein ACLB2K_077589 [Fragaria x ananassa]
MDKDWMLADRRSLRFQTRNWAKHGEPSAMNAKSNEESETVEGLPEGVDSQGEEMSIDSDEFLSYLQGVLKKNKMEDMIQFVDCDQVSTIESGTPITRDHWTLTIVNPEKETARYMDPLIKRLNGSEWPFIVTGSLKMYKGLKKNTGKKQANPWKPLLNNLIQRNATSCGYYVMRYMKDIVEDDNLDPDEKVHGSWDIYLGTAFVHYDFGRC